MGALRPEGLHGIVSWVEDGKENEGCGLFYVTSYAFKELDLRGHYENLIEFYF